MSPLRPIEIIGGGLAGLSLGLALRRAGVVVRVLDAGAYPRHRVCGEFITGLPADTRTRLGLDPLLADAVVNRTIAWFAGRRLVRTHALPAPALSLSRHTLDARLARAFADAGGQLEPNTRSPLTTDAPGRVFATGRRRATPSTWLGLKLHALTLPLAADLELHLGDDAYVGLTRIENGRVNLCGLFRRRPLSGRNVDLFLAHLRAAGLTELAARVRRTPLDESSCCAVAGLAFDRRVGPELPVRLGDTCAMIPPFTGHGMAMAFQSSHLALDPLLAYARGGTEWPETRRRIHQALHRRFRLRLATASALHPFLLHRPRQTWLAALHRARLLPLRALYAALH